MTLLDSVLDTETPVQVTLSPAEAFAVITLAATATDGYLSDKEAHCISSVLSRMKLFKNYPDDVINRLLEKILSILQRDGFNSLFNAAKESLPLELREAAFAMATDLVLANDTATDEEKNFLNDLYQALSISNDIAAQIMRVMSIKNRG